MEWVSFFKIKNPLSGLAGLLSDLSKLRMLIKELKHPNILELRYPEKGKCSLRDPWSGGFTCSTDLNLST